MNIFDEEKFVQFITENPLNFSEKRIKTAKDDFYSERNGLITDELAEFILWKKGLPARYEHFGNFLLPYIQSNDWKSILEVGCGEAFLLSKHLHNQLKGKTSFTAVDICEFTDEAPKIKLIRTEFTGTENLSQYDAVIAQEPCDAAERIIKVCTEQNKPFFVILCGVPHRRLTGELDDDVHQWYDYLLETYPNCKFKIWRNGCFSSGCIYSEKGFGTHHGEGPLSDKQDIS